MIYYAPSNTGYRLTDAWYCPPNGRQWGSLQNAYYSPRNGGPWHPLYNYRWDVSGWSGCSVPCGGGVQTRTASCVQYDAGVSRVVADQYCLNEGLAKPGLSQPCNMQPCPSADTVTMYNFNSCTIGIRLYSQPTGSASNVLIGQGVFSGSTDYKTVVLTDLLYAPYKGIRDIYIIATGELECERANVNSMWLRILRCTPNNSCLFYRANDFYYGNSCFWTSRDLGINTNTGWTMTNFVQEPIGAIPDAGLRCGSPASDRGCHKYVQNGAAICDINRSGQFLAGWIRTY